MNSRRPTVSRGGATRVNVYTFSQAPASSIDPPASGLGGLDAPASIQIVPGLAEIPRDVRSVRTSVAKSSQKQELALASCTATQPLPAHFSRMALRKCFLPGTMPMAGTSVSKPLGRTQRMVEHQPCNRPPFDSCHASKLDAREEPQRWRLYRGGFAVQRGRPCRRKVPLGPR